MSNKHSMNMNENLPKERQYRMVWGEEITATHVITKKLVAKFPSNEASKRLFAGEKVIIVKADIIDGVFTVQKRIK